MALVDIAAERAVLSCICQQGGNAYSDVCDVISQEVFTLTSSKNLWECLETAFKDDTGLKPDLSLIFSVASSVGLKGFYEDPEEQRYLRAIFNNSVRVENIRKLAQKLRKLEIARSLLVVLEQSKRNVENLTGEEQFDDIVGAAERPLSEYIVTLNGDEQNTPKQFADGLAEYLDFVEANPCDIPGISSGFRGYDGMIGGGLRPGIHVVAARRKVGKSIFGDNIAMNVSKQGIPVLVLDTEMSEVDHWNRMVAYESGVPSITIETGRANAQQKRKVRAAAERLSELPWDYLPIHGKAFESTLSAARRWILQRVGLNTEGYANPCVVVFDYIKLMNASSLSSSGLAEYQAIGFMMSQLHDFTARWRVPCLATVQLNQEGKVSQSDRISWLCTSCCFLEEKTEDELAQEIQLAAESGRKYPKWNRKLTLDVTRNAGGDEDRETINFRLERDIARLVEEPHPRLVQSKKTLVELGDISLDG